MAKYLDYAGLQYLWAKIKNYVSTQPLGANVRYDQQTLTTAQQSQARANIMAGGSNRNLLDNPFFTAGSVVNQRGFSSSSTQGYTVDRWRLLRSDIITATLGSDGMTISKSTTGYAFFEQFIGTSIDLDATYTLSVMTSDGQVYSATRKFVNGTSSETYVPIGGMNVGFGLYGKDATPSAALYFGTSQTGSLNIKAIKLELGSVSTLANDAPPEYGEELTRCIYSTADPTDTYANNGFGRSNRNLLDNPFFQVNQRSYTNESAESAYVADRWFLYGAPSLTVTNSGNGIVLTGSGDARLRHHIDERFFMGLYGEPLTFSVKVNGRVYSFTFNNLASRPSAQTGICPDTWIYTEAGRILVSCAWQPTSNIILLFFRAYAPMTIQAVKLEHGTISTLANDAPPDIGEELIKCQRYTRRWSSPSGINCIGCGTAVGATNVSFPIAAGLRAEGSSTVTFSGLTLTDGTSHTVTDVSIAGRGDGQTMRLYVTSTGLTAGKVYFLEISAGGYLQIARDL